MACVSEADKTGCERHSQPCDHAFTPKLSSASVSHPDGENSENNHKDLRQGSSERISVERFTKNLLHLNINYMSAIITITFICSHKTWIQHLFTECHHVPGGVWLEKKKKIHMVCAWNSQPKWERLHRIKRHKNIPNYKP